MRDVLAVFTYEIDKDCVSDLGSLKQNFTSSLDAIFERLILRLKLCLFVAEDPFSF